METMFINSSFVSDIPYLRDLHLHHNPLQKIEANAFEMVPQLVSLDLSHASIKRVAAKAFSHLGQLQKLTLKNNKLSELRQKTVETIKGNTSLELLFILSIHPTTNATE